tara:strand:+ start:1298 stop:1801 length:504 start_codon:yes stop_codon:yes gene_type:complete
MEYELRVIHGNQKSFYKKANVEENDGVKTLISYDTKVCVIKNGCACILGFHSNTTTRHIKEFLIQNGFNAENTKQMQKDYCNNDLSKEVEKEQEEKSNDFLKSVGMVANLGNIFADNQKDKNDWKKRMLIAGLENKGLTIPKDWETLTEDEKTKRLNGVIAITQENK